MLAVSKLEILRVLEVPRVVIFQKYFKSTLLPGTGRSICENLLRVELESTSYDKSNKSRWCRPAVDGANNIGCNNAHISTFPFFSSRRYEYDEAMQQLYLELVETLMTTTSLPLPTTTASAAPDDDDNLYIHTIFFFA